MQLATRPSNPPFALDWKIVLLVTGMALVAGTGYLSASGAMLSPRLLLTGLGAAGLLVLSLIRIEYGILALPVVAMAVPVTVGTGTQSPLVASMICTALLLVIWAVRMLLTARLVLVASPVNLPLVAFAAVAVLSTVNSNVMRPPFVQAWVQVWPTFLQAQVGGLAVLLLSIGSLLLVMNNLREVRWIRWLVWLFLAVGGVTIVAYLVRSQRDLPGFSIGGLFSLWVVVLALGQAFYNRNIPAWGRVALVSLALAWIGRRLVFENFWLSGWLPIVVAVHVLALLRSRRLFVFVAAVGVLVGIVLGPEIYLRQVMGSESQGNFLRLELWEQNFEVTRDHLLLGTGPAGYAPYYVALFPDRALSTHSNYLDVFAQTGLVGMFFFLWFLVAMLGVAMGVRRRWRSGFGGGFANGVVAGFVGVIVAMALGDWLIPFVYNQTIAGFRYTVHSWVFLGALASMRYLAPE